MNHTTSSSKNGLFSPAVLLLGGQLAYIAVTQFHAGGDANDHHEIFEVYAHDLAWGGVHVGQFGAMAIMVAGLLSLASALTRHEGATGWLARFGSTSAIATLALFAALQAVDGVALKQTVMAWAQSTPAEQHARYAAAESMRWLEWGMRSYVDYALGISLVASAGAMTIVQRFPRGLGPVVGLSGVAYLAQGWIAGTEGFSDVQSLAIVSGWGLSLVWMTWLAMWARLPSHQGVGFPANMEQGNAA